MEMRLDAYGSVRGSNVSDGIVGGREGERRGGRVLTGRARLVVGVVGRKRMVSRGEWRGSSMWERITRANGVEVSLCVGG